MDERSRHDDRIRASDAERNRVTAWLAFAFEEGRLDLAEFDRRTAAAYAAVTRGDLVPLTDDLPPPPGAQVAKRPAVGRAAAPGGAAAGRPAVSGKAPDRQVPWLVWLMLVAIGLCVARAGVIWPIALLLVAIPLSGVVRWIFDTPSGRTRNRP